MKAHTHATTQLVSEIQATPTTIKLNEKEIAPMNTTTTISTPAPTSGSTSSTSTDPTAGASAGSTPSTGPAPTTGTSAGSTSSTGADPTAGTGAGSTSPGQPIAIAPIVYVKAPPPITLPPVPTGVVVTPAADARALLPRKAELALVPEAETEIGRIADYPGVFGKVAPSQPVVVQTFDVAYQWSLLVAVLKAWLKYAVAQDVAAWGAVRNLVLRLGPAFSLAVLADPSLGEQCPSLRQLLGVRKAIASRGAAVRTANKKSKAAGQPEYNGKAGKRRKKADAAAALAAQQASAKGSSANAGTVTQPVAAVHPVPAGNGSVAGPAPVVVTAASPGGAAHS